MALRLRTFSIVSASVLLILAGISAAQEQKPANRPELTAAEQAFVDQLANHVMVGTFSVDGRGNQDPKPERYEIGKVTKIGPDLWTIESRIKYGKVDATVPVPVSVYWAKDTPMISVTDLTIPLVGSEFSARVLFHGDRYAGTWSHGKVGGHMWGKLEAKPAAETPAAAPNP